MHIDWQPGAMITQVLTLMTILGGVISFWRASVRHRNQQELQVFLTFVARYEKIIDEFPKEARLAFVYDDQAPADTPELRAAVLRYLNLCSEEFHLHQRGYIPKKVWLIWRAEMLQAVKRPPAVGVWNALRGKFDSHPEFRNMIDREVAAPE